MPTTNPTKTVPLVAARIKVRSDPGAYVSSPSAKSPIKSAATTIKIKLVEGR